MRRLVGAVGVLLVTWPALGVAGVITPIAKWGSQGSGAGQFSTPTGIAIDSDGNVYIADAGTNRIQKFSSSGEFILSWGGSGSEDGVFGQLLSVAVGPDGSVYTTEDGNQRVQKFSSSGVFQTKWGTSGTCDGQFRSPVDIAVDASGNVYVADTGNNRIQKFSSSGEFLAKWGSWQQCPPGDFEGGLQLGGIAIDNLGNLLVADNAVGGFRRFSTDGSPMGQWACCQSTVPGGVGGDGSGRVFVSNPYRDRVQVFSAAGEFIGEFGDTGTDDGQFNWPGDIAVDSAGDVYVIDVSNYRIQKFSGTAATGTRTSSLGRLKAMYR